MAKLRIIADYFEFLRENRKWWIMPVALALVALGALIILVQGSALAPFIYALF